MNTNTTKAVSILAEQTVSTMQPVPAARTSQISTAAYSESASFTASASPAVPAASAASNASAAHPAPASGKVRTRDMVETALMTSVMCILGPLSVPIGVIPVSLTPLAVLLSVYILGTRKGTTACLLYILLGFAGLPVFSGFSGGSARLLGPTGGYIIGFIFMALISGFSIRKFYKQIPLQFAGMFIGLCACYAFGTLWLSYSAGMTIEAALAVGVLPFVLIDMCKIAFSIIIGRTLREQLIRAGLMES